MLDRRTIPCFVHVLYTESLETYTCTQSDSTTRSQVLSGSASRDQVRVKKEG